MNWDQLTCYIAARAREASTWTQLIIVMTAFGAHFTEDQKVAILQLGLFAAGILGAIFPDRIGGQTRATDQPPEQKP